PRPDRDRRDRPERMGDRGGERRGPAPIAAPPPESGGGAVQLPPGELSQGGRPTPIIPPLTPPQPSWKQELKQDAPPAGGGEETKE
ncbi:MAG: 30S ribosomal protein S3, partial [Acidobacteriota bacterium]|nr:30S ribosomal protein S3 [Acidobacteriota bacterium]